MTPDETVQSMNVLPVFNFYQPSNISASGEFELFSTSNVCSEFFKHLITFFSLSNSLIVDFLCKVTVGGLTKEELSCVIGRFCQFFLFIALMLDGNSNQG